MKLAEQIKKKNENLNSFNVLNFEDQFVIKLYGINNGQQTFLNESAPISVSLD
jgi:hypothetical protein